MMKNADIDELLKRIGRDNRLLEIADDYLPVEASWQCGNCWTFAKALQRFLDRGKLWAIAFTDGGGLNASHVMLKIGNRFYDSLGVWTMRAAIQEHNSIFGNEIAVQMCPLHKCDCEDIGQLPSNTCIDKMATRMREILNEVS